MRVVQKCSRVRISFSQFFFVNDEILTVTALPLFYLQFPSSYHYNAITKDIDIHKRNKIRLNVS